MQREFVEHIDTERKGQEEEEKERKETGKGKGLNMTKTNFKNSKWNNEFTRFLIVGVLNTLLGTALTFGLYNMAHMGYWLASGLSYFLASIFSFFMNKTFTFHNRDALIKSAGRFFINIAVCYFLSFGIAKPLTLGVLHSAFTNAAGQLSLSVKVCENISLVVGMILFTLFNFVGQKFFAFRKTSKP